MKKGGATTMPQKTQARQKWRQFFWLKSRFDLRFRATKDLSHEGVSAEDNPVTFKNVDQICLKVPLPCPAM